MFYLQGQSGLMGIKQSFCSLCKLLYHFISAQSIFYKVSLIYANGPKKGYEVFNEALSRTSTP